MEGEMGGTERSKRRANYHQDVLCEKKNLFSIKGENNHEGVLTGERRGSIQLWFLWQPWKAYFPLQSKLARSLCMDSLASQGSC